MWKWFKWVLLVLIIIVIGIVIFFLIKGSKGDVISDVNNEKSPRANNKIIKSIGFNLDYYNSETNKAGDIEFKKFDPPYDFMLTNFGQTMLAQYSADNTEEKNAHPSFILPMGTKLLSPIDGTVVSVTKLYSNDHSVQITPNGKMDSLIFEMEHVKDPIVKVGDKVKAGQPVAEVTDFTSQYHPGYGYFDLAVFRSNSKGEPEHLCPFLYLDESVKDEVYAKIRALYTSWEEYTGDKNTYEEDKYPVPGCTITDPIAG